MNDGRNTDRPEDALGRWRRHAAEKAGGGSIDALYDHALSRLAANDARGVVLDYGAGQGALASRLQASGRFSRVVAADLVDRPKDLPQAIDWIGHDLNHPLPVADGEFDWLVAIEVIEHLESPRAVARDWFRLLRPGGGLLFTTPNTESWRSLLTLAVKGHFQEFTDESYPAHIAALVHLDIARILKEAGFAPPAFDYALTSRLYGGITWAHLLPGLKPGRRTGKHVSVIARKPA